MPRKTNWLNIHTGVFVIDETRAAAEEITCARFSRDVIPQSRFSGDQREDSCQATILVNASCLVCGKNMGELAACEANRAYCGCED